MHKPGKTKEREPYFPDEALGTVQTVQKKMLGWLNVPGGERCAPLSDFLQSDVLDIGRFGGRMDAAQGDDLGKPSKPSAPRHSGKEVEIVNEVPMRVDTTYSFVHTSFPEHTLLKNPILSDAQESAIAGPHPQAVASEHGSGQFPPLVDVFTTRADNFHFRVSEEVSSNCVESSGQQHIVRIQPIENVAGCELATLMEPVGLAFVFLAAPICQRTLKPANDLNASICAYAVADDVFQIGIILGNDRTDCFLEKAFTVKIGRNHRNPRKPLR